MELVKRIHDTAELNIKKKIAQFEKYANKGQKKVVFKPGDWLWLHMSKECFLEKRYSKLLLQSDDPFQVLARINDNAYKLNLLGE